MNGASSKTAVVAFGGTYGRRNRTSASATTTLSQHLLFRISSGAPPAKQLAFARRKKSSSLVGSADAGGHQFRSPHRPRPAGDAGRRALLLRRPLAQLRFAGRVSLPGHQLAGRQLGWNPRALSQSPASTLRVLR